MRPTPLFLALSTLLSPALASQESTRPPSFRVAVGPAWNYYAMGFDLRTEYAVIRWGWFGLHLDGGGLWTPTQSYVQPAAVYGGSSRFVGVTQTAKIHFGLAASIGPWPRGRFSPYAVVGIAAVQTWIRYEGAYENLDGSIAQRIPLTSATRGDFVGIGGLGLRLRLGNRPIQLELRRYGDQMRSFTLGTSLPF